MSCQTRFRESRSNSAAAEAPIRSGIVAGESGRAPAPVHLVPNRPREAMHYGLLSQIAIQSMSIPPEGAIVRPPLERR